MTGHAPFQQLAVRLHVIVARPVVSIGGDGQVPIWLTGEFPGLIKFQRVSGKKLPDPAKHRLVAREIPEREVLGQAALMEFRSHARIRQQSLDLRSEQERPITVAVVQGLDAQAITSNKQLSFATVPDGEGKHAAQVFHTITAVLLVQMDDGLGITFGAIAVTGSLKVHPYLLMVVDLAVIYDPHAFILVGERLMAGLHVSNAQPAHGKTNISLDEEPA